MKKRLFLFITLFTSSVYAGTGTGTVTGYIPYSNGNAEILLFKTSTITDTQNCNTIQRFAIDSNNPRFKNTVAAVMAAYAAGSPIIVRGLNTCNVLGNSEDASYICVGNIPC